MERTLLNRNVRGILAALVATIVGCYSAEAVLSVDTFTTTTAAITVNAGQGVATNTTAGADILGGDREMILQLVSVTTPGNGSFAEVQGQNGLLDFSQQATSQAVLTLQYDGVQNPSDTTLQLGLGSVDLTNPGLPNSFSLTIGSSEAGASVLISIYTNTISRASAATLTVLAPVNAPQTFLMPFAFFSGTADFTDVDAITVQISGAPALDFTLDALTITLPEPTTALFACGIVGVAAFSRRRRVVR